MKTDELKSFILDLGVSDVGFSSIHEIVPRDWDRLNKGISIVIQLSCDIIEDIISGPTETYFSHYRSVNYYINEVTLRIVIYLQNKGYRAVAIPASQSIPGKYYSGIFQHKTAATLSGLGWIGKSGLFIHEKFGPAVRLGTILTDYPVNAGKPYVSSNCGSCTKCKDKCPAMAIEGNLWNQGCERNLLINAQACSEYMKEHYEHIGRGSVCGICISACPVGKDYKIKKSGGID